MQVIPVNPVPDQSLTTTLGGQTVALHIYQTNNYGLYIDVTLAGVIILAGVICQQANRIIRSAYLGFVGDLVWYDNENVANPLDPYYTGLGSRWTLNYLTPADLDGLP
jgi:hypothetical protein